MKMMRWNLMGLVILVLVLNSGLAQAFTLPGNSVPGINKPAVGSRGNIGRAASPRSPLGRGNIGAGIARGAPQMKLVLKELKANNQNAFASGVGLGDRAVAWIEIHNLGTVAGQVRVGYMSVAGRPIVASNTVLVRPRGKADVLLNIRINPPPADRNVHSLRGNDFLWWNPRFTLLTTGNNPYRDSNMRDNTRYVSQPIAVRSKNDLAVVAIEGVKLTETWQGGRVEQSYGTVHPVSLEAIIKVKNKGTQNSQPTIMSVELRGVQSAHTDAEHDPHFVRHRAIDCAGPQCLLGKAVNIAAIRAGDTGSFRVRFDRIPYSIVQSRRHHGRVALGPYICGRQGVMPGRASISVRLQRAAANEAPPLRKDNQLILEGKFGSGDVCGFQNTSARRT